MVMVTPGPPIPPHPPPLDELVNWIFIYHDCFIHVGTGPIGKKRARTILLQNNCVTSGEGQTQHTWRGKLCCKMGSRKVATFIWCNNENTYSTQWNNGIAHSAKSLHVILYEGILTKQAMIENLVQPHKCLYVPNYKKYMFGPTDKHTREGKFDIHLEDFLLIFPIKHTGTCLV